MSASIGPVIIGSKKRERQLKTALSMASATAGGIAVRAFSGRRRAKRDPLGTFTSAAETAINNQVTRRLESQFPELHALNSQYLAGLQKLRTQAIQQRQDVFSQRFDDEWQATGMQRSEEQRRTDTAHASH